MKLNLFAVFAVALVSVEAIKIERVYQFAELENEIDSAAENPNVDKTQKAGAPGKYPTNSGITLESIQ